MTVIGNLDAGRTGQEPPPGCNRQEVHTWCLLSLEIASKWRCLPPETQRQPTGVILIGLLICVLFSQLSVLGHSKFLAGPLDVTHRSNSTARSVGSGSNTGVNLVVIQL